MGVGVVNQKPWLALLRLSLHFWHASPAQSWRMILPFRNCFCLYASWSTCRYSGRCAHSDLSLCIFRWLATLRPYSDTGPIESDQLFVFIGCRSSHNACKNTYLSFKLPLRMAPNTTDLQLKNSPYTLGWNLTLTETLSSSKGEGFPLLVIYINS